MIVFLMVAIFIRVKRKMKASAAGKHRQLK
jgi:hypothetical protein